MFIILFLFLITCGVIVWIKFKKEIINPSVLFVSPFVLMAVIALCKYNEWELSTFSYITLFVIVVGILAFILGVLFGDRIKVYNYSNDIKEKDGISREKLLITLFVECVGSIFFLFSMIRWGSARGLGLSEAIFSSMFAGKFSTGEESIDLPFIINSMLICGRACSLLYMPSLAKNIICRRKNHNFLLAMNILIPIITSLLTGSRGNMVTYFLCFAIMILFEYQIKRKKSKRTPWPLILLIALVSVVLVILFFVGQGLIGRQEYQSGELWNYISVYMGAQIKNLDHYITEYSYHTNYFGYSTLSGIYDGLSRYLGLYFYDGTPDLPFIFINGQSLGNVYTCFYDYYVDGGFLLILVFSLLSGFVSQVVFKKAKTSNKSKISIWKSVYGYLGANLLLSFFANRFYSNVFSVSFARMLVWMIVINWFLKHFEFRSFRYHSTQIRKI